MYVKSSDRLAEAKQLMDQFESESDWFDSIMNSLRRNANTIIIKDNIMKGLVYLTPQSITIEKYIAPI